MKTARAIAGGSGSVKMTQKHNHRSGPKSLYKNKRSTKQRKFQKFLRAEEEIDRIDAAEFFKRNKQNNQDGEM